MPPSEIGTAPQESPGHLSKGHRAAKLAVIILSVLIILAVIALVVGIILKPGRKPVPQAAAASAVFQIPAGMRIRQMATQPGRLILHLENEDGEEIVILDTDDGHLVSRIKAAP